MQPGADTDLSIQLLEKRPSIMVDSNGGLSFPSAGLTGVLTHWSVATIGPRTELSPSSLLNENLDLVVENLPPAPTGSGVLVPIIPASTDHGPDLSLLISGSDKQALRRLVPVVEIVDTAPFASGGSSEVWRGTFQGRPVAVKSLRCYSSPEFVPAEIGIVSLSRSL